MEDRASHPDVPLRIAIRPDDLTGEATRALVRRHLDGMHESSPPESCHALGIEKLQEAGVRFYSAWVDGALAGMGALKVLGPGRGELKSMRVADAFLRRGVGQAILDHLIADARGLGLSSLWLETGSGPSFVPAQAMYERAGFVRCGPFGDYREDPFSVFMTRAV